MNKKLIPLLLFCIIIVASLMRLWQIANVPPAPDWDEAALGYNAYSILQTGKDEYGSFLPIVLRSYDDYKPALYAYLDIPFIKIFGLNTFAVRLPAAIIGILAVLGTYFLAKEVFKNEKIALIAAFLFAISPWHIQFTHAAFEASVGMAFNLFAALFFIKCFKRPSLLLVSVFFISLSIYVYQSEKVFSPLFFLLLIIVYSKQLFKVSKVYIAFGLILGLILTIPLASYTFTNKNALARAKGVSFLSESNSLLKTDSIRLLSDKANNDKLGLILDNRRIVFIKEAIANYLSHFDLNWLYITGDISRHHAPGMGLLYLTLLPFFLIGLYQFIWGNYDMRFKCFLILWFLLVPIPASITTGVPHAIRTINFLPLFQIFIALGLVNSWRYLGFLRNEFKLSLLAVFLLIFTFNFTYYVNQYFVQQNYFNSEDWQYGYAKVVPEIKLRGKNYKKIIVSNVPFMDQSYMFFLFYLQYSPQQYQNDSQYASGGFREIHSFGKYEFRPIDWSKEDKSHNILYVGRTSDFPANVNVIYKVNFLDNSPDMEIVEG